MISINTIHVGSRTYLSPDEIEFIQADFSYSHIFLKNGRRILVSTNLQKLQERFGENMVRVHRSFLINPLAELTIYEKEFVSKSGNKGLISRRMGKNINLRS
ncbi:MAG: LytTR family transcriptional regulator DNA-binding domain-containing protein [Cytophagaceae bacterium]|nr:LytTR family transcriptional regulator DNA-binding domain-containing protein [Cytophagaceae bacterium]MBK9510230.1 LytTR family transcriptional regulator DNA-binding domain-containing protein [Cytophagaceae bacterium]MBK9934747.1 LytTR family transcriptional regulator DNA-binding domain-containing protein [Cytophagaceae bacterium]MBL0301185.1 LytTR family transcriptional regulator DNA-binding domain-containing protein [Cytophagaceae bacterium]MBL0324002.1 LytTR family transcriptional regulat